MPISSSKRVLVPYPHFLSLVYHDLFNYPLKKEELEFWALGRNTSSFVEISSYKGFFFLKDRDEVVVCRQTREFESKKKLEIAKKAAAVLSLLPSIKLLGVSGSVGMENARKDDDIDLFIVTAVDTLWITRLLCILLLKLAGFKIRRSGDKHVQDKLCLNLWVDEANLDFGARQDIYTAHEITQLKVLLDRDATYQKLLGHNPWVKEFFPNARRRLSLKKSAGWGNLKKFVIRILRFLNFPSFVLQFYYMSGKKTCEGIGRGRAFFHPAPWRKSISCAFKERLRKVSFEKKYTELPHKLYKLTS